jgi:ATP-binding cassette, subfamily B, bacterial PglK
MPFELGKVWQLLTRAERRSGVALLGLMCIGMVLETLGIGLVVPVIALLAQPDFLQRSSRLQALLVQLGAPSHATLILGAMLALTAVFLVKNSFLAFLTLRQTRFAFQVQEHLSERLFNHYMHQPYVFHLQRNSADILRYVISEVSLFANMGLIPGMVLLSELMVLVGICALLMVIEPLGALIVISVLGLAGLGFLQLMRKRIARWGHTRQHHDGLRVQHVQQGFGGIKDVKVLGREAEFLARFRVHNVASTRVSQLHAAMMQIPRLWLEMLAITGLTVLVVAMMARGRPIEAILPTLGLFAAAAFRLMPSANRVISSAQSLRYCAPVVSTLSKETAALNDEIAPIATRSPEGDMAGPIEFENVHFSYPAASRPALNGVSLRVAPGESVGFIGASGAGKSTLVDLLLGLLEPSSGSIRVGGKDIGNNARAWQDRIGYVPQSIYLTDDTLRRNVAFGVADEQIDDTAVWRALRAAQLEEFVSAQPQGLDAVVGERGVRLSGGQRQRIGIARALYRDPAVLVLDEATSSLDGATELGVMQSVQALPADKTVIVVAHRLSTVQDCDRLYRLQEGRIVAEGTPSAVLSQRHSG